MVWLQRPRGHFGFPEGERTRWHAQRDAIRRLCPAWLKHPSLDDHRNTTLTIYDGTLHAKIPERPMSECIACTQSRDGTTGTLLVANHRNRPGRGRESR